MNDSDREIDLRSDTVTRPSAAMRRAMASAEVGDDVYGEDPTVNRLESQAAERMGAEDGLFVSSGTQGNLLALMSHCARGDEYIVGRDAHVYNYEGGGGAALVGAQARTLTVEEDGTLALAQVRAAIRADDYHFPRTRLVCLENTLFGKVLPMDYMQRAETLAREHGLALHLDGARVFNAAVKLGVPVADIGRHFDSVSFCLSKGLGAPVGSVLCGSKDLVAKARRWRKMLGGGMRQVGIVAAAGLFALDHHVERLAEDHDNALALGQGLAEIDAIDFDPASVQTNMLFLRLDPGTAEELRSHLRQHGILIGGGHNVRLVTHLDVTREDVERVVRIVKSFFAGSVSLRLGA